MESNNPKRTDQTNNMEHVRKYEKRNNADLKWGKELRPVNGEGCGKSNGIDKTYTFDMVKALAYQMPEKPNIIIKSGKKAMWYIKKCATAEIDQEIEKMKNSCFWPRARRCTMHIIEWDE
jgi:hypothetical protein